MTVLSSDAAQPRLDFGRLSPRIRRELRALCKLDNHHAILGLLFDYAVVAVAVFLCVGVSYWFYPLALILIGSTQRALVNLLHEASHKVLARNGLLNVVLGTVFSGHLVFHMYNPYRSSHIGFHHRFLGDEAKDPDYGFHRECGIYDPAVSSRAFFLRNILLAVFGLRSARYVRYVVEDRLLFRQDQVAVSMPISLRAERWLLLGVWTGILTPLALGGFLLEFVLFWLVPLFTTAIAVGWLSELAEHYPLPESENRQILMTRNRHGWAIERFLLGRHNDNFHLVHHLNTGVPFWNMRKAHRVLLGDEAYASWDGLWAGIVTRSRGGRHKETLISYAAKYRDWRRAGGDPRAVDRSFAELAAISRRQLGT
ncbi:fatty acid desaturase family protein [Actinophytocola sp.]|uniref:fatty acid desaturase family protein n=1 Tax=Actinophytocola sp. TaxID=1872138 RepID=UPI002D7F0DF2|nr:fatty acid desaturase family protein [Actinophytocola sp.]HET9138979.1 fatty acid desaturase family protein [Actinophytocola sp.]HEU5107102.1 fatty acid desaturase family protein [Micromonosporaceae bacterium]